MANKPSWVQDPNDPNRMTYTAPDGSVHEAVKDDAPEALETTEADPYGEAAVAEAPEAPVAQAQATSQPSWVQDPKNPNRMTLTDVDGTVHEAVKDGPSEAPSDNGVPFIGGSVPMAQRPQEPQQDRFSEAIGRQGGWGISQESTDALGGSGSPLAGAADIAFRGMQATQAASEVAAEGVDDLFEKTGLADKLSYNGNKFLPGTAAMALAEAFPLGGLEIGHMPKPRVVGVDGAEVMPEAKIAPSRAELEAAHAAEVDFQGKAGELFQNPNSTREDFDQLAQAHGRDAFGPDLDKALEHRDQATAFVAAKAVEQGAEEYAQAAEKNKAAAAEGLFKARTVDPSVPKTVDEAVAHITKLTEDWSNPPRIEIADDFANLADDTLRDSLDPEALGVLGPDGKVLINMKNVASEAKAAGVTQEDLLSSIVFHEGLGHYGLAQKFGDTLNQTLDDFYTNSTGNFKQKVDDWMASNPDYYEGAEKPHVLAAEEVLAEMSERGAIPVELKDRLTNQVKSFSRQIGVNLKYSDREIGSILGMAHDSVINGNAMDVVSNGFRYARVYHGSPYDFDSFNHNHKEEGRGTQLLGHGTYVTEDKEYAKVYRGGPSGKLYSADIPDEGFADWDKKLSEQPEVFEKMQKAGLNPRKPFTFGQAYQDQVFEHGAQEVSDRLSAQGLKGHGYKDYDKTQNYVVYKPEDVKIAEKYMRRRRRSGDDLDEPTGAMMAGNLNLDRIDTVHDVSRVVDELSKSAPIEKKSWNQVKSEARALNLNPTKLAKEKTGVGNISAKLFAYRQVQTETLDRVAELSKRLDENYNDVDHANYLQKLNQLALIQARVSNDTAEVGRALNSLKMISQSNKRSSQILEALASANLPISSLADKDTFMRFMKNVQALQDSGNPEGAAALMTRVVKPYWEDYVLSGRHSMMLSGLGTHYKNARDNMNMIGREYLEATTGALATGGRGITKEEIAGRTYGLIRAALDSMTYKDTYQAFKDGTQNTMLNTKTELEAARIPVLSKVGDALNASDVLFRKFIESSNMYALGVREARKQGFTGKQLFEQGSHIALNPTEEMLKASRSMADVSLLVSEPSRLAKGIESIKARQVEMNAGQRMGRFVAHLLFPFLRTTENLLYQQLRRSPLSFMDGRTREDFMAGGERRTTAVTRTVLGSAIIGYYIYEAEKGDVTGNDKDFKKVQALEPGGYKPNSVKADGSYTDASALNLSFPNPFGLDNATATTVATLVDTYKNMVKTEGKGAAAGATVKAFVNLMSQSSFADNLAPYQAAAAEGPQQSSKAANAVGGLASQFVPALGRQLNNALSDTEKRDYTGDRGFSDRVKGRVESGIPGLSDNFPLRYDVYGQPVEKGVGVTGVGASNKRPTDPTVKEMVRVEETIDKPVVTAAPRKITVSGQEAALTGEKYATYQKYVGEDLRSLMGQIVKTDTYKGLSDKEKREVLREAQTEARKSAKERLMPQLEMSDFKDPDKDK